MKNILLCSTSLPPGTKQKLFLTRGTSWIDLWNWRVLDLGQGPNYHLLTTRQLAEYPKTLSEVDAARRAFAEFPGCQLYMRVDDANAPPLRHENLRLARVMPTVAEVV